MPLDEQLEVMASAAMQQHVASHLHLLNDISDPRNWQPSDLLPDLSCENEQLAQFRKEAAGLSLPVLVVLIGNLITEEGLPTYMSILNRTPGLADSTGVSESPLAKWLRGWTAEEFRHGQVLHTLLRLHQNVNLRIVENSSQYTQAAGFYARTNHLPCQTTAYTTFQEWATMHSHNNVAVLAGRDGDESCRRICKKIAGDEARHERFYSAMLSKMLELDPAETIIAINDMVRAGIVMPAERMSDGETVRLYDRFARVAARIGVFTPSDYWRHVQDTVESLGLRKLSVAGEAAKAQEEVCSAFERNNVAAERLTRILSRSKPEAFTWLYGKKA